MTRRTIVYKGRKATVHEGYYFISQEFNGDKDEAILWNPQTPIKGNWIDVVELFNGIESLHDFRKAIKRAEDLYTYETISGLFDNITVPSGCHKEYRITFQARTGGNNQITIYLNNIATSSKGTWSGESFRIIGATKFFKESDITLETTMGYSAQGTNLKYQVSGTANNWNIRYIAVQGFITTDSQIYTWRRTA